MSLVDRTPSGRQPTRQRLARFLPADRSVRIAVQGLVEHRVAYSNYLAAGFNCSTAWPSFNEEALFRITVSLSEMPLVTSNSSATLMPSWIGAFVALPPISR